MGKFSNYHVGDTVVALCDHPEDSRVLRQGDTGTVVRVHGGENGVLVSWHVAPNDCLHYGNNNSELPSRTGWNIYHPSDIAIVHEPDYSIPTDKEVEDLFD